MKHTFLVSDESINNHGFKVLTEGIDTTQFERNPIMLYMHKRPTVIGRWENLKKKEGKLYADAVFDVDDTQSSEIAGKVDRGFLKGASIGISSIKFDEKKEIVLSSRLQEISIVDLGANDNALRLYEDKDLVELSLTELRASNSLINVLKLSDNIDFNMIVETVKTLQSENEVYKNQLSKINVEQTKEAEFLVDMVIQRNLAPKGTKNIYLHMFSEDFYKGKQAIIDLLPLKTQSFIEQIETFKKTNKNQSKSLKLKSEWNLDDYRKFAPKELESNPELFKELVSKKFNN